MRIFGILPVSEKKTELKIEDYKDITLKSFGVFYGSERLKPGKIGLKKEKAIQLSNISDARIDDNEELFLIDGYLSDKNGRKLVRERFSKMPFILSVEKDGEKVKTAIENGAGIFFGKSYGRILVPKGNEYLFYDKKILTFSKNKILFCVLAKSVQNGYIVLPVFLGKIAGITVFDGGLYAICEKGAVNIANDNESGFSIEIKCRWNFSVTENSVEAVYDRLLFLSDGKLFYYKDGKVTKENSLLDNGEYTFTGDKSVKDSKYIVSVSDEEGEYFFVKDISTGEDSLIKKGTLKQIGDGKFLDAEKREIYSVSVSGDLESEWESKPYIFDTEKTVFNIKLYSKTPAVMKVKGDFGESVFRVKAGNNEFRTNLKSKSFIFIFCFTGNGFSLGKQIISFRD